MTKNDALSRPAMSAIAAFLVLSTPAALAQETPTITMTPPVAAPAPQAPPTVAEPAPAPQTIAPQTAQPSTPAPVIRVPLDIADEAAEAAEATAPARAPTERPAPRARSAAPAPVASAASTPASTPAAVPALPDAAPIEEAAPIAAPVIAPAEPVMETAAPAEGNAFPWEIAGGIAALLIVGGTGLVFARRRRVTAADPVAYETVAARTQPVAPIVATPEQAVVAAPTVAEWRPAAPRFAATAPQGSMGRHEAIAIAGPTPDNPFATLKKRLKRARFLDRQERIQYAATLAEQKDMRRKPVSAWEIAQRDIPAPAEQEVRRPEPGPGRASDLRPGWLRS